MTQVKTFYLARHRRAGRLIGERLVGNVVVTAGLNDLVSTYFAGVAYSAAHYIGLMDATPTLAAGDTMAAHAGWAEITGFDEVARPVFTPGAVAAGAVNNSADPALFSFNATASIGGMFLTTSATKGGTAGVLYSVAALSGGDLAVVDGDTLELTAVAFAGGAYGAFQFVDGSTLEFVDGEPFQFV